MFEPQKIYATWDNMSHNVINERGWELAICSSEKSIKFNKIFIFLYKLKQNVLFHIFFSSIFTDFHIYIYFYFCCNLNFNFHKKNYNLLLHHWENFTSYSEVLFMKYYKHNIYGWHIKNFKQKILKVAPLRFWIYCNWFEIKMFIIWLLI